MKSNRITSAGHSSNTLVSRSQFKPILFSTDMVKAILAGRKTQTRRIIKSDANRIFWNPIVVNGYGGYCDEHGNPVKHKHNIGDILWVRETWFYGGEMDENEQVSECRYWYRADSDWQQLEWVDENEDFRNAPKWKPSLFMPKDACRLFLEVTHVRPERLHNISEGDAIAEGVDFDYTMADGRSYVNYMNQHKSGKMVAELETARSSYHSLWDKINGSESWKENPWVWVIDFKVVECPKGFC